MTESLIRIVVADDHALVRAGITGVLDATPEFDLVGEAATGREAIELVAKHDPHVAVLDISMPGLNGIEVTRRLSRECPSVMVVILSMHSDRRFVLEALRAGARGYLLKDSGFPEFLRAVRAVREGRIHLGSAVSEQVVRDYLSLADAEEGSVFALLSAREREVLQLLAEGVSTKEIAERLNLSVKTVESYRRRVRAKLKLPSNPRLMQEAVRWIETRSKC